MLIMDHFEPVEFRSSGSIEIGGRKIKYDTVSEDNVFYDEAGLPIASIFSFSYFNSEVADTSERPVIFAFNGGPGSSSIMLHTGLLGTRRIRYADDLDGVRATPPYETIENPECLLDIADIVLVDPVGTGFGLLLDEKHAGDFYGIREDAEAFLFFVQKWLQKYERWNSPKYIIGESYGSTRAVMAADLASGPGTGRCYDFSFDGLVLIGSTVTSGRYFNVDVPVEKSVLSFPTYAAINWYHNTDHQVPLARWVEDAKRFADREYLSALYSGYRLSGPDRQKIKDSIMFYTGVSDEYLESRHLRIDSYSVKNEVLKKKGRAVSRLDGRITRSLYPTILEEEAYGMGSDAVRSRYNSIFMGALVSGIFPVLGLSGFSRTYKAAIKISSVWNKDTGISGAECLCNVMKRSPGTRVFFANGYYDLTTEVGLTYYMLDHTDLPRDRVFLKEYPTGHMVYLGNSEVEKFAEDLRRFITSSADSGSQNRL